MKRSSITTNAQNVERGATYQGRASGACVPEKDIVRAILDYCKAHRIFVERRNVAGMQKLNGDRYVRLGKKGMADLWGIKKGMHWECEVKRLGKEPTDVQFAWLSECANAGACAFWTDSLDGFIEIIERLS